MTAFPATRLSVVERTRSGDAATRRIALSAIIEAYWKPSYKYLRVKWSLDPDAAADLTQEFFTSTLEKEVIERYDPARARFRTYLRLCLDGFAANARKAEHRLKRGGGSAVRLPRDDRHAVLLGDHPARIDRRVGRWIRDGELSRGRQKFHGIKPIMPHDDR